MRTVLLLSLFMARMACAVPGYTIPNGGSQDVNEWGTCRKITNSSGNSVYIPTNSSAEWSSAMATPPSGVSVTTCAPATCPATTISSCVLPLGDNDRVYSGTCQGLPDSGGGGSAYSCMYRCLNGAWIIVTNTCPPSYGRTSTPSVPGRGPSG